MIHLCHAIQTKGADSIIENNHINGFSGDGIRPLGDRTLVYRNIIENSYVIDHDLATANHDDAIQMWPDPSDADGLLSEVQIRSNWIFSWTGDEGHPLRGYRLHGIAGFNGGYVDLVIENNMVFTDNYNGIIIDGGLRVAVVNNTVLDQYASGTGPARIGMGEDHDDVAPQDCLVRNNIANEIVLYEGTTEDHNLIVDFDSMQDHFIDPVGFDFHLLEGSAAIDMGSSEGAPSLDIEGTPRPQGGAMDIGAFEWQDEIVELEEGLEVEEILEEELEPLEDMELIVEESVVEESVVEEAVVEVLEDEAMDILEQSPTDVSEVSESDSGEDTNPGELSSQADALDGAAEVEDAAGNSEDGCSCAIQRKAEQPLLPLTLLLSSVFFAGLIWRRRSR